MKLIEIDGLLRRPKDIQGMEADNNIITSFKGRTIETNCLMEIYRNLNRKGKVYSIRQQGIVVAHTTAICIADCEFIVNQSGKARVIKTKQRNVHAYIRGFFRTSGMGTTAKRNDLPITITYNPFIDKGFHDTQSGEEVNGAMMCIINEEGVKASYLH